jgi:hypothetical protein
MPCPATPWYLYPVLALMVLFFGWDLLFSRESHRALRDHAVHILRDIARFLGTDRR